MLPIFHLKRNRLTVCYEIYHILSFRIGGGGGSNTIQAVFVFWDIASFLITHFDYLKVICYP